MILAALVTMVGLGTALEAPKPMGMLWEEPPSVQQTPGYHPMLRFGCWDITRFSRSSTYMFQSPYMVQQGQFSSQGTKYSFRAVMANEIEVADKDKLISEFDPQQADQIGKAYATSMSDFPGTYNPTRRSLTISYKVRGVMRTFDLYAVNEGDDRLPTKVSGPARALVGLWGAPDPHPQRLDARTRQKIDEMGLQRFFDEAAQSDAAVFAVMDLRPDGSVRYHKETGTWKLEGSTLSIAFSMSKQVFQLSRDGSQLLNAGRVVFVRA